MRNIRSLCVAGATADELPEALLTRLTSGDATAPQKGALLLPALKRLVFRDVKWRLTHEAWSCTACDSEDEDEMEACENGRRALDLVERLERSLRGRSLRGAGIRSLRVVRGLNFGEEGKSLLAGIVPRVRWHNQLQEWNDPWSETSTDSNDDGN